MLQRTPCFDARSIFILCLMLVASFAPAAALEVTATTKDATLTIGDDVVLSWEGLAPDTLYRVTVTDEVGQVVVERELKSDPSGVLEPAYVWIGTGIVGCDGVTQPSPDEYLNARVEEAEAMLKGRTFELALADAESQTSIARIPMLMSAAADNLFWFSDDQGCPRCRFDPGEAVHLTGMQVLFNSFWMFLVEEFEQPPEIGDPLYDVRGGPQEISVHSSYLIEQVASGLPNPDDYQGVVRGLDDGTRTDPDPFWTDIDEIVDPSFCGRDECQEEDTVPLNSIRTRPPDKRTCIVGGGEEEE